MLAVANLQRALDFYLQSLGFTKSWDCDKARQAAVARDQVELILAERRDPYPGAVYILVDEIETLYLLFEPRVTVQSNLSSKDYGMDEFEILDPDGNQLVFAEQND